MPCGFQPCKTLPSSPTKHFWLQRVIPYLLILDPLSIYFRQKVAMKCGLISIVMRGMGDTADRRPN